MRTILIGAVESTAVALHAMQEMGFPPALVVTFDPDTGQQHHSDYVDISGVADSGTRILRITGSINEPAFVAHIASLEPDIIFVIGWSQIASAELRGTAKRFVIGFHPTALPQLRGRAAIAWSILLGLKETGTSLFVIDDGVDSGALLAQQTFQIAPRETAATLIGKHMTALASMLRDLMPRLADGTARSIAQRTTNISYGAKRVAGDGAIDWTRSTAEIDRLIRACTRPYPGAFTFTRKRRIQIWEATPIEPDAIWFGHPGQVVFYDEARPVALCGDGGYLRIDAFETTGQTLSGQVRFFDRTE